MVAFIRDVNVDEFALEQADGLAEAHGDRRQEHGDGQKQEQREDPAQGHEEVLNEWGKGVGSNKPVGFHQGTLQVESEETNFSQGPTGHEEEKSIQAEPAPETNTVKHLQTLQ